MILSSAGRQDDQFMELVVGPIAIFGMPSEDVNLHHSTRLSRNPQGTSISGSQPDPCIDEQSAGRALHMAGYVGFGDIAELCRSVIG
jgi:hypothetical protein